MRIAGWCEMKLAKCYFKIWLVLGICSGSIAEASTAQLTRDNIRLYSLPIYLGAMVEHEAAASPQLINAFTELFSVQMKGYQGKYLVHYQLRITDIDVREGSSMMIERARNASRRVEGNNLCTSPVPATLIKEYNVTYRLTYLDSAYRHIHEFDIDKTTCTELGV